MKRRLKKKHPEDFVGKSVSWSFEHGSALVARDGVVVSQELILQVRQPDGNVVGVDSRIVKVRDAG